MNFSKFYFDSLNGLVMKLLSEVDTLGANGETQVNIHEITKEIFKRIEEHEEEMQEVVDNLERLKGGL